MFKEEQVNLLLLLAGAGLREKPRAIVKVGMLFHSRLRFLLIGMTTGIKPGLLARNGTF